MGGWVVSYIDTVKKGAKCPRLSTQGRLKKLKAVEIYFYVFVD